MAELGWIRLVIVGLQGDFAVFRENYHSQRSRGAALLAFCLQPSSGALPLMRVAATAPKLVSLLTRRRLLRRYATDVEHGARIAPGLLLAHATGMVIGGGVELSRGVKLHQNVTFGQLRGGCPVLEEDVYVFPGCVVVGPITIGRGASLGANAFVAADVEPGATVRGGERWLGPPRDAS